MTKKLDEPKDDPIEEPATPENPEDESTEEPVEEPKKDDGMIPRSRFNEVNERLKELLAKQEEADAEAERLRIKALEDNKEFETLATQRAARIEELEAEAERSKESIDRQTVILEGFVESQMEAVPELYRGLFQNMGLVEQIEWLTKNKDSLLETPIKGINPTPKPNNRKNTLTDEERRKRARRTV